ncbi:MAG: 23S rRNA (pseudouridine(1915)-N(3))-methyltransferase RlmH [Bdellovibrionales bacterium]|nr:23S rRNA (pseudouridine(1915)-N(3))-methyltransferase RlmH [Bdellovibrionales bacterium]
MLSLKLLAFGKLRTPGLREAADHYSKMLGAWARLEELELKPEPVVDRSASGRSRVQAREAERLLEKFPPSAKLYLLDEAGKAEPTSRWAERVRDWERAGQPVCVAVGGSQGFSAELRTRASGLLALGPQTLSHELARVVLLEQLYRAWSVTRGHPYHVEG